MNSLHDRFFAGAFSIREIALTYIKFFVAKKIPYKIVEKTFRLEDKSYLDENLTKSLSDLVYSCRLEDGQNAKVTFLFEHKSYLPNFPHFQVGKYLLNVLEQNYKQEENFSIVIPILIYHGNRKWKYIRLSDYYKDYPTYALPFFPDFELIVTNLNEYSDDFLLKLLKDKLLLNTFLALKHSRERDYVMKKLNVILTGLTKLSKNGVDRNLLKMIFVYLSAVNRISEGILQELFNHLPTEAKKMAMKVLERLESKTATELLDVELELLQKQARLEEALYMLREAQAKAERDVKEAKAAAKAKAAEKSELRTKKQILRFSKNYKYSPQMIAEMLELSEMYVKKILKEHKE